MATAVPAQLWEAFEDVALYFTRKEWEQLQDGDKMLYREQMLRNYQALVSLGYQGPTPDLIGRIQQGEVELWVYDDEEPGECICSEGLSPAHTGMVSRADQWPPEEDPANLEVVSTRNQLPMAWEQRAAELQKSLTSLSPAHFLPGERSEQRESRLHSQGHLGGCPVEGSPVDQAPSVQLLCSSKAALTISLLLQF
ncbi:hypothetical protein Y1Q_0001962 [Alligator mississippiensis]|uniref:Uncharacterized protein n=1 Tax=Alligator mississippiensis TaxID=8496 RepID=A0A151PGD2_ALLMI|nr:hypothetical protein Y1Q_0001962 [Alligator mississippiensis]